MRPWLPLALAVAWLSQPAAAFDLTGTWVGKQTCKSADGTRFSFKIPSTLLISQNGSEIAMHVVTEGGTDVYNGVGIDLADKPEGGDAYFVHCSTSDVPGTGADAFDEAGRATVKAKETGSGSFKATSTYFNTVPETGTCKWSYLRTDVVDPDVDACPD
jgi:hypothetical protein